MDFLFELLLFTSKGIIFVILFLFLFTGIVAIAARGKQKNKDQIIIKNLNKKYKKLRLLMLETMLSKAKFKKILKSEKKTASSKIKKNIFLLNFQGDMKASAVNHLREEITAILNIATTQDEVIVQIESTGGMVHAYGLAAAQLLRIRKRHIHLTAIVDKVAASGGYMMACVANKIISAPYAIIGSIGVIVQLPNFNRLLKEKNIDFEQLTAGSFKRTLTLFGHNTEGAREKMQEEIEAIHHLFKNLIQEHRPNLDIQKVATGEHWLGIQALELNLVDELATSDDYLLDRNEKAHIYHIEHHEKKSLGEKILSFGGNAFNHFFSNVSAFF